MGEAAVRLLPAGEAALVVEFGDAIDPAINDRVAALAAALATAPLRGLGEAVQTYRSLLIHYDPLVVSAEHLCQHVTRLATGDGAALQRQTRTLEVPTAYVGEHGPDLSSVAALTGLSERDVIRLHSETLYTVYMVGFLPGFPYLGLLPEALTTPRLETPRTAVPAGAVAIAGRQTGIYPLQSPGGWRIIGHTPLLLFDPERDPPAWLAPGDQVRFVPIGVDQLAQARKEQRWL
jgi:KipI family sensor histidine kinase inhibitor